MWKKIAIVGAAGAVVLGGGAAAVAAATTDTSGSGTSASPSPSTSSSTPAKSAHHGKAGHARKVLGRFEHAEWVSKDGTANVTHDAVHGTVKSVSPTSITVQASDGFSLTFTVNADTKVQVRDTSSTTTSRPKGKAGTINNVKAGDTVLVSGVKSGGAVDAKHVVDGLPK